MKLIICLAAVALFSMSDRLENSPNQKVASDYNFSSPYKTLILPERLKEVSGITVIDTATVGLIQDENGILFIYNIRENLIKSQITFGGNGDYEDIALVNNTIYVLRSDGTLFAIADFKTSNFRVSTYKSGVPSSDSEGLCYDKNNNRLLIACKGDIKKENFRKKRAIYSFDLKTMKLLSEPAFVFDTGSISKLTENSISSSKEDKGKKDKEDEADIRMSAIGFQPGTGKLFVLSASDYLLLTVKNSGAVEKAEYIDKKLFPQAEGLAFLPSGDLLITNEAKDKKPHLLWFKNNSEW